MTYKEFYGQFSRMLYSISTKTEDLQLEEVAKFRKTVKNQLIKLDNSKEIFDNSDEMFTEYELEETAEENHSMQGAFEAFMTFFKQNKTKINTELAELISEAVINVSDSLPNIKPDEKMLIEKLKDMLSVNLEA